MKRGHLISFLYGASTLMFMQFFVRYLLNTGFNSQNLGLVMAIAFTIDLIISIPTGVLADTLGVKKVSIIGLSVLVIASFLGSFSSNWILITLGFFLYKIADSTVSGVINLWAKNIPDSNVGSSGLIFTRLDQMQRIGMVLMAIFTGFLIQKTGYNSSKPWILSMLVTLILILVASKTDCTSSVQAKYRSTKEVLNKLKNNLNGNKNLQLALAGVFVLGIAEGLMNSKYWVWIVEDLKLGSPLAIALIVGFLSASRVAGQEFFVRTIKNERSRFLTALFGISVITFVFATNLPPIILAALWFVRVFVYASYFPLLSKELETFSDPETVSSILSSAPLLNATGAIIGGLSCSTLKMNSSETFITMAFLCLISSALWFFALSPSKKPAPSF